MKITVCNVNTLKKGSDLKTNVQDFINVLEENDMFGLIEVKIDASYYLPFLWHLSMSSLRTRPIMKE